MKIILALTTFLLIPFASLYGIETSEAYNLAYRQLKYKLVDMQGDYSLATRVRMSPKAIWLTTIGKEKELNDYLNNISKEKEKYNDIFNPFERLMDYEIYAENEGRDLGQDNIDLIKNDNTLSKGQKESAIVDYLNERLVIEGRDNPINREGMINALKQVISEEYHKSNISPKRGEFHQWAAGFKDEYTSDSLLVLPVSKLLAALALGKSYLYMKTDKEKELVEKILEHRKNDLTFPELFRISYQINHGDIYLSLLTVENLLSYHWMDKNRDSLAVINRLRPINNFYKNKGDKFGSWYHLYGLILYGYVKGNVKGSIVGFIESIGSFIMSGGEDEMQEDWINEQGSPIGSALRKFIDTREFYTWESSKDWTKEDAHLNLNEDFRDRLYFAHDERFEIKLDKERREPQAQRSTIIFSIKSKGIELLGCKVEVFSEERNRKNNKLMSTYNKIDFKLNKRKDLYFYSADPSIFYRIQNFKAEISNCLNDDGIYRVSTKLVTLAGDR